MDPTTTTPPPSPAPTRTPTLNKTTTITTMAVALIVAVGVPLRLLFYCSYSHFSYPQYFDSSLSMRNVLTTTINVRLLQLLRF